MRLTLGQSHLTAHESHFLMMSMHMSVLHLHENKLENAKATYAQPWHAINGDG